MIKLPSCAILATFALTIITTAPRAAERIEAFYGTWVRVGQKEPYCSNSTKGEIGHFFIIGKKAYRTGDSGDCMEVQTSLEGNKLWISASCPSSESGFQPIVRHIH